MAAPNFITKTRFSVDQAMSVGSVLVIDRYQQLRDRLIALHGRDVALFAEPVVTRRGDLLEIAWYTEQAGEPVPITFLDDAGRQGAEADLRAKLAALQPFLASSDIGKSLSRALCLADPDSIYAIDGRAVLINWGLRPPHVSASDPQALDRNFATTLGPYAPSSWPGAESAAATKAPLPGDPPAAARTLVPAHARGLLVATAVAAAVALLATLPGILRQSAAVTGPTAEDLATQKAVTEAMVDKVRRAREGLRGATCTALNPRGASNGATASAAKLAEIADKSIVFVIAVEKDQAAGQNKPNGDSHTLSLGSGFYIGPTTIVTNRHVIEDSNGDVRVTNHVLKTPRQARVVAKTMTSEISKPDFAVLEVDPDAASTPLALSFDAHKLMDVVAMGFPGNVTRSDPEYIRLLKMGDQRAVPEVVTTRGFVTVVQDPEGDVPRILHQAATAHGSSGGPLVDMCGAVLGVNTFGSNNSNDYIVFQALSSKALAAFLDANKIAYSRQSTPCAAGANGIPSAAADPAPSPGPDK